MTKDQMCILVDVIDVATEFNWSNFVFGIDERGLSAKEVCDVVNGLCEQVGRAPIMEESDF